MLISRFEYRVRLPPGLIEARLQVVDQDVTVDDCPRSPLHSFRSFSTYLRLSMCLCFQVPNPTPFRSVVDSLMSRSTARRTASAPEVYLLAAEAGECPQLLFPQVHDRSHQSSHVSSSCYRQANQGQKNPFHLGRLAEDEARKKLRSIRRDLGEAPDADPRRNSGAKGEAGLRPQGAATADGAIHPGASARRHEDRNVLEPLTWSCHYPKPEEKPCSDCSLLRLTGRCNVQSLTPSDCAVRRYCSCVVAARPRNGSSSSSFRREAYSGIRSGGSRTVGFELGRSCHGHGAGRIEDQLAPDDKAAGGNTNGVRSWGLGLDAR